MDILEALKREEEKLQKQADTVRAAIKILGGRVTSSGKRIGRKKRKMSAAMRAKIGKATKVRWAKFRAAKAKGKH